MQRENNLLGNVCGVMLTISDLTEAKFWPVYGGRNWGGGRKALVLLLPQEKVDLHSSTLLPSLIA